MNSHYYWSLIFFIGIRSAFVNINEIKNNILQWKQQNVLNLSEIGASSSGIFDFSDVKNKILQWKNQKLAALCPSNGASLQNLLNIVCSTAQPTNVTSRDACITCFSRVTSMTEGPQELTALSTCATQYFVNTSYAPCAAALAVYSRGGPIVRQSISDEGIREELKELFKYYRHTHSDFSIFSNKSSICIQKVSFGDGCGTDDEDHKWAPELVSGTYFKVSFQALSTSALNVQPSGCFMGYCDFVRCLRRINSINLITQCTREARTGVNITLDADNVRFYTNVTSCLLAKARCSTFNPITGDPQTPGYTTSGARISNALQFSAAGELRILAFSAGTPISTSFCSTSSNLTQTSWLTNVC